MVGLICNNNKKRLSISLSFFSQNDQIHKRSIKSNFQLNRVVGLGIVAALGETREPNRVLAVSPRSNPIPILNSVSKFDGTNLIEKKEYFDGDHDEMELSEEYTCVISHIGDNLIKKREYFDGVLANETQTTATYWGSLQGGGDELAVEKAASFQAADFLKSCYHCKKHLHGLDIFMYRGDKAFCSDECRCKQMATDEQKEKEKVKRRSLGAGATMMTMTTTLMNKASFEFSSSTPCSSPMQLSAAA